MSRRLLLILRIPRHLFAAFALYGMFCSGTADSIASAQSPRLHSSAPQTIKKQSTEKLYTLAHFLGDFEVRDEGHTLCLGCGQEHGSPVTMRDFKVATEKRQLGAVAGHAMLEIHTSFSAANDDSRDGPATPGDVWKSIVIESGPGLYRELYFIQDEFSQYVEPMSWASLDEIDHEKILATNDPFGGNGGMCSDGYWNVDTSGAHEIDFSRVDRAMVRVTPKGSGLVQTRCWALDMPAETIETSAQKPNVCHACGYTAKITAHFHLKGDLAIPDSVKAEPMDDESRQ